MLYSSVEYPTWKYHMIWLPVVSLWGSGCKISQSNICFTRTSKHFHSLWRVSAHLWDMLHTSYTYADGGQGLQNVCLYCRKAKSCAVQSPENKFARFSSFKNVTASPIPMLRLLESRNHVPGHWPRTKRSGGQKSCSRYAVEPPTNLTASTEGQGYVLET